jgi:hypothetical protein
MNDQKIVKDWIIATQEAIYSLQEWQGRLETWLTQGRVEPADFAEACWQLREAGLWGWAREAGGHGLARLAATLGVTEVDEGGTPDGLLLACVTDKVACWPEDEPPPV